MSLFFFVFLFEKVSLCLFLHPRQYDIWSSISTHLRWLSQKWTNLPLWWPLRRLSAPKRPKWDWIRLRTQGGSSSLLPSHYHIHSFRVDNPIKFTLPHQNGPALLNTCNSHFATSSPSWSYNLMHADDHFHLAKSFDRFFPCKSHRGPHHVRRTSTCQLWEFSLYPIGLNVVHRLVPFRRRCRRHHPRPRPPRGRSCSRVFSLPFDPGRLGPCNQESGSSWLSYPKEYNREEQVSTWTLGQVLELRDYGQGGNASKSTSAGLRSHTHGHAAKTLSPSILVTKRKATRPTRLLSAVLFQGCCKRKRERGVDWGRENAENVRWSGARARSPHALGDFESEARTPLLFWGKLFRQGV